MIEIRELPSQEFDRLKDFADGFCPNADHSVALVAEDDKNLIGRIFLISPVHIEGPHVEPDYRGSTVFKRLVVAAEEKARAEGINKVFCFAKDDQMADYIERLGYKPSQLTVYEKVL